MLQFLNSNFLAIDVPDLAKTI